MDKKNEIAGLIEWKKVEIKNIWEGPSDENILVGRFFCEFKSHISHNEMEKALYVVQGHHDKENTFIVQNITTLRQCSF